MPCLHYGTCHGQSEIDVPNLTKLSTTCLFAIGDFFSFVVIGCGLGRSDFSDPLPPLSKLSNASVPNIEYAATRMNSGKLGSYKGDYV